MAEYPNMTVLWAMRDFCLKRVDGRNGRGYTDIAIAYYNLRVSLVGGPITQNFDKSNSYC